MSKASLFVTALLGLCVVASSARAAEEVAPRIFGSKPEDALKSRADIRAGKNKALAEWAKDQVKDADKLLDDKPYSVMDKKFDSPSKDRHDYASLSPYWWPDPSKPDGKPYIRKDGQFNPERANFDLDPLDKMSRAVESLGLAYFLSGDEKYAAKAAEFVRAWFLNPETRMNPNLRHAQFVFGYNEPRPSGVIEGTRFRRVVDGVGFLAGSSSWTPEDDKALKAWFGELLQYLLDSEQGKQERAQGNNHGTWYFVQAGTYALYTDNKQRARELIEEPFKKLIASQLTAEGLQPEEAARTQSLHYHRYNLVALFDLATLGERIGLDLWNYKTSDGKSLRLALDFLYPYAIEGKKWPHQQIHEVKPGDMINLFRRAANAYNEPKYEAAAKKLQEADKREMVDFLYPSKLK